MRSPLELTAASLHRPCPPAELPFETTRDAPAFEGVLGQPRALDALHFGLGITRPGFNVFACGPSGVGKETLVRQLLEQQAAHADTPPDWVYVQDFNDTERPRVLELPAGLGLRLQRQMAEAVAELRLGMRAAFESEEYRSRKQQLLTRFKEKQERALGEVQQEARGRDVAVVQTESGIVVAPMQGGEPMDPEKFGTLPSEERERLHQALEHVGAELQALLRRFREWGRVHHEEVKALDREIATTVAHKGLDEPRSAFAKFPAVLDYLGQVERDVIDSADEFLQGDGEDFETMVRRALHRDGNGAAFRRYQVNLLVDNGGRQGAPIVHEDNPTLGNLVGRIEHESQFGALVANFTLIRSGALHRANGGYLVLDALEVLRRPWAWEGLKRTLRAGSVNIESLAQALGAVSTVSLQPTPVPLRDTKVVLTGERQLYYLLAALDPEFPELFKVLVDFEDEMGREPKDQAAYAALVAALVKKEQLRPFDRTAVARTLDHAARRAGDAEKLSVHMRAIVDLLHEADYWAGQRRRTVVSAEDVQAALDAQRRRGSRVRERLLEAVRRGDVLLSTTGERVGQVNGLAVYQLGDQAFGHPSRISARVRLGKGEVVDIEREVELGGPIHSKGVLILSGFLGARYATRTPLALSASLVFEQSYGGIEGDSASLAELCALLSALGEVPVKQSLAVTGSVNQHGEVQPIGGVNEKVEGFFDVCLEAGPLTGEQGVLVPRRNVKNLMLRRDVVEAVEAGRFHVWAVNTVDEALELLTGRPAGERAADGHFPEKSVNAAVEARVVAFAKAARDFAKAKGS